MCKCVCMRVYGECVCMCINVCVHVAKNFKKSHCKCNMCLLHRW